MPKRNDNINTYPIVEVIWIDAEEIGDVGWNDKKDMLREAKKPCPVMRTVGFCVYRDDNHISVVSTLGEQDCSRLDKIPTAFIQAVNTLRE